MSSGKHPAAALATAALLTALLPGTSMAARPPQAVTAPPDSQTAVGKPHVPPVTVNAVRVVRGDGVAIEISGSGPLQAETERLSRPERLVVDIRNAVFAGESSKIDVDAGDIRSVRIGQHTANDQPVTRVVVDLAAPHEFDVTPAGNQLKLTPRGTGATARPAPAAPPADSQAAPGKPRSQPVTVHAVRVVRGENGVEIEISGSGPMQAETMRLSRPERFVIDVKNAVFAGDSNKIDAGAGDVRSVRIGQQTVNDRPVTRVVVDLAVPREFDITPAGNLLKLTPRRTDAASAEAQREKAGSRAQKASAGPPAAGSVGIGIRHRRGLAGMPEEQSSRRAGQVIVPSPAATLPPHATEAAPGKPEQVAKTTGFEPATLLPPSPFPPAQLAAVPPPPTALPPSAFPQAQLAAVPPPPTAVAPATFPQAQLSPVPPPPTAVAPTAPEAASGALPAGQNNPAVTAERTAESKTSSAVAASQTSVKAPEEQMPAPPPAQAELAQLPTPSVPEPPAPIPVQTAEATAPVPEVGIGVTGRGEDKTLGVDVEERSPRQREPARASAGEMSNRDEQLPPPLRLSGTATAGYYQADTRDGYVTHEASPVGSMRFDASGYFHSPEFLSFTVKPQGSVGRQSSEGVFPDGDGVAGSATFLGGGVSPLTVSYNRLNRKLVTFGPLDRLAGLDADTSQDSLGANWKLRLKRLPELGVNFSKYSDSYEPLEPLAPKTANDSRLLSADIGEKALGWNLQSSYKTERSSQDLINIFDPAQEPYLYQRREQEARASADRDFGQWLSLAFMGGRTKSQNEVQGRPFDQSFRFLSGNTSIRPTKKLTLALRGGVTDNLIGATLESAVGSVPLAPQSILLVPTSANLQLVSYSGSAQYALSNDLRVHTDATRETTRAPQNSGIVAANSTLTSLQAGLGYTHRFRWWQLQSDYAANGGRFDYVSTGASRSYGQRANLGATIGSLHSLELSAGLQGNLQNVSGGSYMRDRSWGANLTVSRTLWEHWTLRATYNREQDRYNFADTRFSSVGNGATLAVIHPRAEFSASYNLRDGLTFQADPRLQYVSSSQVGLLLGAFPNTLIVPTGATWSNAALRLHPVAKLTARVAWLRSWQRLQSAVNNNYSEWEASAGYQFRSVTFDAGYLLHNQDFGMDLFERNRLFVRVVREFTIF